jgi:hypothetical protein
MRFIREIKIIFFYMATIADQNPFSRTLWMWNTFRRKTTGEFLRDNLIAIDKAGNHHCVRKDGCFLLFIE